MPGRCLARGWVSYLGTVPVGTSWMALQRLLGRLSPREAIRSTKVKLPFYLLTFSLLLACDPEAC